MWIAEVHRMAHPESQPGSYANVASGVVSMLSPARRSRIGPIWVARTTGRLSDRTSLSLDDLQPGNRRALRESSWLPNLIGAKRRNHSSTVPKTGLRLVCSMRARNSPLRPYLKTGLGKRRYTPRGLPAKPVGRLSDAGIVRPAPARHRVISFCR